MNSLLPRYRRALVLTLHGILAAAAYFAAFVLRFDGFDWDAILVGIFIHTLPLAVLLKTIAVSRFNLASGLWRYVGMADLVRILKAVTVSTILFIICIVFVRGLRGYPRSVFLIDYILTVTLFGGIRFASRAYREAFRPSNVGSARRTLIVGAGDTGEQAVRSIQRDSPIHHVVGFLDDDTSKHHLRIHDIPVLGSMTDAPALIEELEIQEVVIAIPRAGKAVVRRLVEECSAPGVSFRIVPAFRDLISGAVRLEQMREVRVEDLLGRDPIDLERGRVSEEIAGRCVLVTGAGGSIGAELARQVSQYGPSLLILLDVAETPLFHVEQELKRKVPNLDMLPIIGDIKQPEFLDALFQQHRPDFVFHAAAYKHVPLMERHPVEAILNNVRGTYNLIEASGKYGTEKFVMISTDKAVRPTNVMGATKRCAELLVSTNQWTDSTTFCTVRFGNVLGSNGSVVPTFRRQIAAGGPVTVTHPDIERFFMTIPEAVELVLQASTIGQSRDVFVLDMGEPVRIVDLAERMIALTGLEPGRDIEIAFTGLRPGEKMYEELTAYGESLEPTEIPKLNVMHNCGAERNVEHIQREIQELLETAATRQEELARRTLWAVVRRHDPDIMARPTPAPAVEATA